MNGGGTDSDSAGGFNISSGATLNIGGRTYTFNASSLISGGGNVNVSGGTANFNGPVTVTGSVTDTGGTANYNNSVNFGGTTTLTVNGTANFNSSYSIGNSTALVVGGTANFSGSGTVTVASLNLTGTLEGNSPVSVSGAMMFNGGTILNPAGVFANGTLIITNNPVIGQYTYTPGLVYGLLVNGGTATWNSGNLNLNGAGVFSNAPGGTFNWNVGSTVNNNYADNLFANAGQINVTAGNGTASMNPVFNNSGTGTVSIISGTLSMNSGGTDSDSGGGFIIPSGTTLEHWGEHLHVRCRLDDHRRGQRKHDRRDS